MTLPSELITMNSAGLTVEDWNPNWTRAYIPSKSLKPFRRSLWHCRADGAGIIASKLKMKLFHLFCYISYVCLVIVLVLTVKDISASIARIGEIKVSTVQPWYSYYIILHDVSMIIMCNRDSVYAWKVTMRSQVLLEYKMDMQRGKVIPMAALKVYIYTIIMRILWPIPHLLYSLIESYMFCSQKWHILDGHKRTFVTSWPFLAHLAFCL